MDDIMTRFSPKATRFIEAAVDELADHDVKAIWMSAGHDPGTEVPDHVARAALKALHYFENQLRARLDTYPPLDEDEASDLSNDLGFVCAVERDLRQQIGTQS
jgi:hypothetical protein